MDYGWRCRLVLLLLLLLLLLLDETVAAALWAVAFEPSVRVE